MNKKTKFLAVLIVTILIIGTIFYYWETTKPITANLQTTLAISEIPNNSPYNVPSPLPYDYLYITGSVNNTGKGTAYNAGLHVLAYGANGELEINKTIPLINGATYGTDVETNAYVYSSYGNSSLTLESLQGKQNVTIEVGIFHEGVVSNWTITPVWTNLP
jgi:hypothetical protein